jgi:hypothetical protein
MSAKTALVSSWRGRSRPKSFIFATPLAGRVQDERRGDPNLEVRG